RAERAAKDERLSHAVDVLTPPMQANLRMLKSARNALAGGGFVTGLPLHVSAWDAAKSDITPLLRDIELKVLLAHHFEQLALFAAHAERHAAYFIGMPATLEGADKLRAQLGEELLPFADRLIGEIEKLLKDLGAARAA